MDNKDIVMTLSEVAEYLKLAEKTVSRMVHRGEIPCAKVGSQWRFLKTIIDDWLISKMRVIPRNDLAKLMLSGQGIVPLTPLVHEDFILMDLAPGAKEVILRQLIKPLIRHRLIQNEDEFLKKLLLRESMVSTAVGKGVAIPHVRNPEENPSGTPLLIFGHCFEGTDFNSMDGHKTYLFFLLIMDSEVVHLRILARLTRMLQNSEFISQLISARTAEGVIQILRMADRMEEKI